MTQVRTNQIALRSIVVVLPILIFESVALLVVSNPKRNRRTSALLLSGKMSGLSLAGQLASTSFLWL